MHATTRVDEKSGRKIGQHKDLIIGIGNSGRSDDGLGWAFAESVEQSGLCDADVILRYQLQIEDAELISNYDRVLFVDACAQPVERGADIRSVPEVVEYTYSTHALKPEAVVALCHEIYGKQPETRVMAIEGKEWELNIGLSAAGRKNLVTALELFEVFHTEEWAN